MKIRAIHKNSDIGYGQFEQVIVVGLESVSHDHFAWCVMSDGKIRRLNLDNIEVVDLGYLPDELQI